jgi:hypothetical protein
MRWLASMLDPPSEYDDRQTREKLDEDERTPEDAAADAADRMRDKLLAEEDEVAND